MHRAPNQQALGARWRRRRSHQETQDKNGGKSAPGGGGGMGKPRGRCWGASVRCAGGSLALVRMHGSAFCMSCCVCLYVKESLSVASANENILFFLIGNQTEQSMSTLSLLFTAQEAFFFSSSDSRSCSGPSQSATH